MPPGFPLGFEVRKLAKTDWTRDEITLACELVMDNSWRYLTEENPKVQELSALLQSPAIYPLDERGPSVETDRFYALFLLAATTGLRRAELCGVRWPSTWKPRHSRLSQAHWW